MERAKRRALLFLVSPGFRLGFEEGFDFIEGGGEFVAVVAEDDLPRLLVLEHVAAVLGDLAERLLAPHQQHAIAVAQPLHAALLRAGGVLHAHAPAFAAPEASKQEDEISPCYPRRAASMAATSILRIFIMASKARLA